MKVSFARRGGWAAAINLRSPPAVLDVDTLPQAEREELERLAAGDGSLEVIHTEGRLVGAIPFKGRGFYTPALFMPSGFPRMSLLGSSMNTATSRYYAEGVSAPSGLQLSTLPKHVHR